MCFWILSSVAASSCAFLSNVISDSHSLLKFYRNSTDIYR